MLYRSHLAELCITDSGQRCCRQTNSALVGDERPGFDVAGGKENNVKARRSRTLKGLHLSGLARGYKHDPPLPPASRLLPAKHLTVS
jgi:hypothetical protein